MANSMHRFLCLLVVAAGFHSAFAEVPHDDGYIPAVLITGSNRGIGLEFARQYAEKKWLVIATARKPEKADDLQALAAMHDNVVIEKLDVNDLPGVDALAEKYAAQPIDVLINNAALSGSPSPKQLFGKVDYDRFDLFMKTNVRGPLKVSEAFSRQLRNGRHKKLVVISSLGGSFGEENATSNGTMVYRTSKAALNMLMLNVADAVKKHDISVTILNPGLVDTQGMLTKMNDKMSLGLNITRIEDSVAGMINVIDSASLDTSGQWFQWSGEQVSF